MTALVKGGRYRGTVTSTLRGVRRERSVVFTSARDQDPEPFIRDRSTTPDQDRVFVSGRRFRFGGIDSAPELFVTGSIEEVAS